LFSALSKLILDAVPSDPSREEYRHGKTMGTAFRLFFRFDSKSQILIFASVNDENTLRSSESKSDPYRLFQRMLERGHPPDDWGALLAASRNDWR
jgi:toxin YhaV